MRDIISFRVFTASVTLMMDLWIFTLCRRNTRRPELKAEIAAAVKGISTETLAYMPSPEKLKFSAIVFVMMCFTVRPCSHIWVFNWPTGSDYHWTK
jgi:hypothetical protein